MELMKVENGKVTSLELVKEINFFRNQEENKSEIRHYDLMKIIRSEFEEEIALGEISLSSYTNTNNRQMVMIELTVNQAKQVLVRESKLVRKAVIKRLDELENLSNKPMTIEDMIIQSAQSLKALKTEVVALENKVDNMITMDSGKQRKLQNAIAKRVYERFYSIPGDEFKNSVEEHNKMLDKKKRKLFSGIHRELKNKFGVSSYKDIKVSEFDMALNFVENWIENADIREVI